MLQVNPIIVSPTASPAVRRIAADANRALRGRLAFLDRTSVNKLAREYRKRPHLLSNVYEDLPLSDPAYAVRKLQAIVAREREPWRLFKARAALLMARYCRRFERDLETVW